MLTGSFSDTYQLVNKNGLRAFSRKYSLFPRNYRVVGNGRFVQNTSFCQQVLANAFILDMFSFNMGLFVRLGYKETAGMCYVRERRIESVTQIFTGRVQQNLATERGECLMRPREAWFYSLLTSQTAFVFKFSKDICVTRSLRPQTRNRLRRLSRSNVTPFEWNSNRVEMLYKINGDKNQR